MSYSRMAPILRCTKLNALLGHHVVISDEETSLLVLPAAYKAGALGLENLLRLH